MRALTSIVGSVAEAWGEFRVHKGRVMLSLVGVAVAVAALTGVVAFGTIAQQKLTESFERSSGRPALLSIQTPYDPMTGQQSTDTAGFDEAFRTAMERYDVTYWSRSQYGQVTMPSPEGTMDFGLQVVDPAYGPMHRLTMSQGSWLTPRDGERMAPAVIVDDGTWARLGSPDLRSHPTVELSGGIRTTAVIVGTVPAQCPECSGGYILADSWERLAQPPTNPDESFFGGSTYEAWVPPEVADELTMRLQSELGAAAGEGYVADVYRTDYLAYQGEDPLMIARIAVGAVAGLVLLLGALGLLNISLVTVRTRIREIGIRRSFGATAPRVFFGVLMESVVATLAAGVVGVALAVLALKNPWVADLVSQQGIEDMPPFPFEAAIFGLVAATVVGALAGLIPALVAVRVKPIDAIRY